jgi:hypothetical protein
MCGRTYCLKLYCRSVPNVYLLCTYCVAGRIVSSFTAQGVFTQYIVIDRMRSRGMICNMHIYMYVCRYVCMYIRMYVYIYVYI